MQSFWRWFAIILAVLLVILLVALPFYFGRYGYGYGHMSMMGGRFGGWPMMGGFGFFGGLMMLGFFLVPAAVIALLVLGGVALVRGNRPPQPPQPPVVTRNCAHCGRPLQPDWMACPYCGEKV